MNRMLVLLVLGTVLSGGAAIAGSDDVPPSSDCTFEKYGNPAMNGPGFAGVSNGTKYCCRKEGVMNHKPLSAPAKCMGRTTSIKNKVCGCYTGFLGTPLSGSRLKAAQVKYPDLKEGDIHPEELAKYQRNPEFVALPNSGCVYLERSGGSGLCCASGQFSAIK